MTATLVVTDNQDGSGATAVLTQAGSFSATVYASPVVQSPVGSVPAWTAAASGSGTNTLTLSLPLAPAYWWAYAALTQGLSTTFTQPTLFAASRAVLSVQTQLELAIQARIQSLCPLLGLTTPPGDIGAASVYRMDSLAPTMVAAVNWPAVVVATPEEPEQPKDVVSGADDLGRPVAVLVGAKIPAGYLPPAGQPSMADSVKLWRERIYRALRNQPLPGVPPTSPVYWVQVEPGPVLSWKPDSYDLVVSGFKVRGWNRDPRGI